VCVLANDDTHGTTVEPSSRLYLVGTGLRKDGSMPIVLTMRSR
jgi:hypothetical protein